jgi:1,4-dihydroxy-2-naphthoyl-CoA hydrolase
VDAETRQQFERIGHGGFVEALGLEFDDVTSDRVTAHLDCGPAHHQPYGIVHGGVYATIVETLASIAGAVNAMGGGNVVVGVSNQTDFLRAHRLGRIDAVAEPVHRGRSQHLWQVVITRASDGKALARGQVRLQVLPQDRDLAGQPAS